MEWKQQKAIEKQERKKKRRSDFISKRLGDINRKIEKEIEVEEKERRERVRSQKKEIQERKIEERLKASLLRSQAPVHKKTGKQIMFRSAPLHMAKKVVKVDDGFEVAKKDFSVFGIHFQHGTPEAEEPLPSL